MHRYIVLFLITGTVSAQDCVADDGTEGVELWGECYSIENTTSIFLPNNGLTGEIPQGIGSLINLTDLNLDGNNLSGPIIPELGNLTQLTLLRLQGNQLEGGIPLEILNLQNLEHLELSDNPIGGHIPTEIEGLVNLNYLGIWNMQLRGLIPLEICEMGLQVIGVGDNRLCPPYPPCINEIGNQNTSFCNQIEDCIALDNSYGVELWDDCFSIENTTSINLSNSGLSETIPLKITHLTNLEILNLSNNQIMGTIPSEIGVLDNLKHLYLDNNLLSGSIPYQINNLINLNSLRLNNNQLSGWFSSILCNLPIEFDETNLDSLNLPFFDISNNQLCPPYSSCIESYVGFQDTSNCAQLFTCAADDGTDGIELWGNCYSIENTTSISRWLGGLEGIIPPVIGDLYNLEFLDLWYNNLVGEIPQTLGNLTNLNYLSLGRNQLSGEIPSEIYSLTNLETLHIQENNIAGEISPQIGNLVNLSWIMFNNNQLSGEIPSEISNIQNDGIDPGGGIHLQLHNNLLSGAIPETICDMNLAYGAYADGHHGFKIYGNKLCPPYPSCLSEYVGEQDTTNCNQVSIFNDLIPNPYQLYHAYPNPFNPITNIRYELAKETLVEIIIYDLLGNVINNLVHAYQSSGYKTIQWNATNNQGQPVSAGVYLYTIEAGDFRQTKKMILLK